MEQRLPLPLGANHKTVEAVTAPRSVTAGLDDDRRLPALLLDPDPVPGDEAVLIPKSSSCKPPRPLQSLAGRRHGACVRNLVIGRAQRVDVS